MGGPNRTTRMRRLSETAEGSKDFEKNQPTNASSIVRRRDPERYRRAQLLVKSDAEALVIGPESPKYCTARRKGVRMRY